MSSIRSMAAAAIVLGAALTVHAFSDPTAQGAPPVAQAPGGSAQGAPAGRGGGRGNAAAALYTDKCSGCHGRGVEGGRAPSLFDAKWNYASDDESLAKVIHDGIEGTEMEP